jgi:hypothetical protein
VERGACAEVQVACRMEHEVQVARRTEHEVKPRDVVKKPPGGDGHAAANADGGDDLTAMVNVNDGDGVVEANETADARYASYATSENDDQTPSEAAVVESWIEVP